MEFLAHRGFWFHREERNTLAALCRALDEGYGLETDIRDLNGKLVISHDTPRSSCALPIDILFKYYANGGYESTLALNIKSDGLQELLLNKIQEYNIAHYFVFDMSIPDTLGYFQRNMNTFIRRSDIESHPEIAEKAEGTWLDELITPWINAHAIMEASKLTNAVCIVSSELHQRTHNFQWAQIENALSLGCPSDKLLLCTDIPHEAKKVFI